MHPRHRRDRRPWPLLLFLATGCAFGSGRQLILPSGFHDVPGRGPEAAGLAAARALADRGEDPAALLAVERLLAKHPRHVNIHRLRQDLLRRRGRLGLVLREAEDRLDAEPKGAWAHYLSGRVRAGQIEKREAFQRAVDSDSGFFWGWFGLAFTLREENPKIATEIYDYLYTKSEHEVRTAVSYADNLWRTGRALAAYKVFEQVARGDAGVGALGMAEARIRMGKPDEAWPHVLVALRERPYDAGVRGVIATLLTRGMPDDRVQAVLDELRRDPAELGAFRAQHPSLLAALLVRAGDPLAAVEVLRATPRLVPTDRFLLRELLISTGDVAGFLADLREGMVGEFLDDSANRILGRWRVLYSGDWMEHPDPLADVPRATSLARALREVGYLQFCDRIASRALLRHGDAAAGLRQLRDEVRREIAFESGLKRIMQKTWLAHRHGKTEALDDVLGQIRELSVRVLGQDVVGKPETFELPWVGTLIDSLGPGLPAHLARYNKHLVMGQRSGGPTEAMVVTRLSVKQVEPVDGLPLPPRCIEVVGEHRQLDPLQQGDLAGIALLNHYVVDMDEVRNWAATIARRREIAREDGEVVLRDALPRRVSPLEPAGVEWRLSLLSPVEDAHLETAVLDIIRWHERGHMVDFLHYLPWELNLFRTLALVVRNGFDTLSVTAEMEGRAELAALAMSPHTRLVLAHIAGFMAGDHAESPHAVGFREMVEDLQAELRSRGVADSDVHAWHRLDPAVMRATARAVLGRLW